MEEINQAKKGYDYAVYLLGLHLRTEGELRERMRQKGYKPEVVDEVLKQLIQQKFVDDARYAEIYLDNLKKYKNFGFYGIKKKLMEKRLPQEIIASVLTEGLHVEEELKIAERFLKKQNSLPRSASDVRRVREGVKAKQKISRQLASRGFRSDVIAKLVF